MIAQIKRRQNSNLRSRIVRKRVRAAHRRRALLPRLLVTTHRTLRQMGAPDQREPVLPVSLLDAVAGGLTHPVDAALGLHRMAQAKHLPDHDGTLCGEHVGLAFDLGIDPWLEMLGRGGYSTALANFI